MLNTSLTCELAIPWLKFHFHSNAIFNSANWVLLEYFRHNKHSRLVTNPNIVYNIKNSCANNMLTRTLLTHLELANFVTIGNWPMVETSFPPNSLYGTWNVMNKLSFTSLFAITFFFNHLILGTVSNWCFRIPKKNTQSCHIVLMIKLVLLDYRFRLLLMRLHGKHSVSARWSEFGVKTF